MTLNITVVTRRCIYQSADYRLFDFRTNKWFDFETQKVVLMTRYKWNATVCFCGVGQTTNNLDVSDWLAERIASIQNDDPFERLIDELMKANKWLSPLRPPNKELSFSVGAFVGSQPVFVLLSNFEKPGGLTSLASSKLSVFKVRPTKATTFVSGSGRIFTTRTQRKKLAALARRDPDPKLMYDALAEVNRDVANQDPQERVSQACYTTHVRLTGEGGGQVHGIGTRPFVPKFTMGREDEVTRKFLDEHFGPGQYQHVGMTTVRADPSDEYHKTQLKEKPNDAATHSNYGAYLKDIKGDVEGAEREYRKAIEIDGNHVNAIGNLANLFWERGDRDQAKSLYVKALEIDPVNENVTWNYVRFLLSGGERMNLDAIRQILDRTIRSHSSDRLLQLRKNLGD